MPATKAQKHKTRQEPVFPDKIAFEGFLEIVEYTARGADVKPENIRLILELLKEKFGQGLPEDQYAAG